MLKHILEALDELSRLKTNKHEIRRNYWEGVGKELEGGNRGALHQNTLYVCMDSSNNKKKYSLTIIEATTFLVLTGAYHK